MKHLALDVGERRIGIAVSDERGWLARPLGTIQRVSKVEDFARIARLAREHVVSCLVIGLPLNADGSAGLQAQRIRRYASALSGALCAEGLDLSIAFWDERMSTVEAQEAMIAAGRKARDRRTRIDAVAAAVILQDYLDQQRLARADS